MKEILLVVSCIILILFLKDVMSVLIILCIILCVISYLQKSGKINIM